MNDILNINNAVQVRRNINNPSHCKYDIFKQSDEDIINKRKKIKTICKKLNNFRKRVSNSTDYLKCVEILFNTAGTRCALKKKKLSSIQKNGQHQLNGFSEKDIFFSGFIDHLEFFDAEKLHTFFKKNFYLNSETKSKSIVNVEHVLKKNRGLLNVNSSIVGGKEIQIFNGRNKYTKLCEDKSENYAKNGEKEVAKKGEGETENKNVTKSVSSRKNISCIYGEIEKTKDAPFNNLERECSQGNLVRSANECYFPGNKRKNTKMIDCNYHDSSFNKRKSINEYGMSTMLVPSENFKKIVTRMSFEEDDISDHSEEKEILSRKDYIKKQNLIFRVSNIVFENDTSDWEHLSYQVNKSNDLTFISSQSNEQKKKNGNDNVRIKCQELMTKIGFKMNNNSYAGYTRKESGDTLKGDRTYFYNLFLSLSVHMNMLFSTCLELLKYDFSVLSYNSSALSDESKELIKLINLFQKQEQFLSGFIKDILRNAKNRIPGFCNSDDSKSGLGSNVGSRDETGSESGGSGGSDGSGDSLLTRNEMVIVKQIANFLRKWEKLDLNILIKFTNYTMKNHENVYRVEIANHHIVKYNFVLRKAQLCKYNNKIIICLRRRFLLCFNESSNEVHKLGDSFSPIEPKELIQNGSIKKKKKKCDVKLNALVKNYHENAFDAISSYSRFRMNSLGKESAKKGNCKNNGCHKGNSNYCIGEQAEKPMLQNASSRSLSSMNLPSMGSLNYGEAANTNQMKIIVYLSSMLTNEINCSENVKMKMEKQVEETRNLFLDIKKIHHFLVGEDNQMKNSELFEKEYSKMDTFKKYLLTFSSNDSNEMYLPHHIPQDENLPTLNVHFDLADRIYVKGGNTYNEQMERGKYKNELSHIYSHTKMSTYNNTLKEGEIEYTVCKKNNNIYILRNMIITIFIHLVKCYLDICNMYKVKVEEETAKEFLHKQVKEEEKRNATLEAELEQTKIENLLIREHLEGEKKDIAHLSEQIEAQKKIIDDAKIALEREAEKVQEMTMQVENEKSVSAKLRMHLEGDKKEIAHMNEQIEKQKKVIDDAKIALEREEEKVQEITMQVENEKSVSANLRMQVEGNEKEIEHLNDQIETQKKIIEDAKIDLEKEAEKVQEMIVQTEKEKIINDALFEELDEEKRVSACLREQLVGKEEEIANLSEEVERQKKSIDELKAGLECKRREAEEIAIQKKYIDELEVELKGEREKNEESNARIEKEKSTSASLKVQLEGKEEEIANLSEEVARKNNFIDELEVDLEKEREKNEESNALIEKEKSACENLKVQLEGKEEEIANLSEEVTRQKKFIDELEVDLDREKEKNDESNALIEKEKLACENLKVQLVGKEEEIANLSEEVARKNNFIDELEVDLEKERKKNEESNALIEKEKSACENLKVQLEGKEEEIANLSEE
ncbi:conserved Plasmodium protein, unknown function, partial [Plasmodium ovale curtisi]